METGRIRWRCLYIDERGYSFIELILVLVMLSILIIGSSKFFREFIYYYRVKDVKNELKLEGNYVLDYIEREIKNCEIIYDHLDVEDLNEEMPLNIGFIMGNRLGGKMNYSTYELVGSSLYRWAINLDPDVEKITAKMLKGKNMMLEDVYEFKSRGYKRSDDTFIIGFTLEKEGIAMEFKKRIYLGNNNGT